MSRFEKNMGIYFLTQVFLKDISIMEHLIAGAQKFIIRTIVRPFFTKPHHNFTPIF